MADPASANPRVIPGLFIVFEGGDGAGKSTQVELLARWLADRDTPHLTTREPGGTWLGDRIREVVLDPESGPICDRAEALLYAADKAQHVAQVIEPALARGITVVCDRYVDSALAYQGAGRAVDVGELGYVMSWATTRRRPDLTVLLDIDPADGVHTIGTPDRLESAGAEFHARVRAGFLELASLDPDRYLVLAARQPVDEIAAAVRAEVEARLAELANSNHSRDESAPRDDALSEQGRSDQKPSDPSGTLAP